MSMIYVSLGMDDVSGGNVAGSVLRELQEHDKDNCYISPALAFWHLGCNYKDKIELYYDLMTVCDSVLVVGEMTKGVMLELCLAKKLGMEIKYLDRTFKKRMDSPY